MHNGCLLLLAIVAVFQPIASYTEPGLVNGRQQRCDYRTSVRDPGLNFHGTYRFAKPAVEERRLNHREDILDVRRNEVREDSLRIASSTDRRLGDTVARDRNTPKRSSRNRIASDAVLQRETREVRLPSYRDDRVRESSQQRLTRVHITQARSPSRQENSRLSDDGNRYQRIDNRRSDERRVSVESRRDTQRKRNGNKAELQRVTENREMRLAINRVRDNVASRLNDRRLITDGDQRMDTQRFASRIQLDRNADREVLDRRSKNRELRGTSTSSSRVGRAYSYEDSRILVSRVETKPLDRENRRTTNSRQSIDERRELRDISQTRRTTEPRYNRESVNGRNLRDLSSENRREPQFIERARSTESRRENPETESKARLVRAVRSVDASVSQDDRSSSRISQRLSSTVTRRVVRDARSMDRIRSLERSTEYRKDSRSADRVRLVENRNNRIIERESRTMNNVPSAETRRDTRNVERDSPLFQLNLKRTTEVRRATQNRNTCALDRESSSEPRMIRMITRDRSQENRRDSRNVNSRSFDTERTEQSRRGARSYLESRIFKTERTQERRRDSRDIRRNLESRSRPFRTERTAENREVVRNLESRVFRTERAEQFRGNARNDDSGLSRTERADNSRNGFRAFGTERAIDSRRNIPDSEMRSVSLDRAIEYRRDNRNNDRDTRKYDRVVVNRRNTRNTEDERVVNNRRVARNLQRNTRSVNRESSMESRLNERMATRDSRTSMLERRTEDRRERTPENRLDARIIRKDLRTLDSQDRRIESRGINLVRSRDDLTQRKTDRLNKRDSLHNRHSRYTVQRESNRDTQRTSERDNLDTRQREAESLNVGFNRKREFQSMFRNPAQAENEPTTMNWQYIFYTVQALYICGMLMQLNKGSTDKKTRVSWWSAPQRLIKVE